MPPSSPSSGPFHRPSPSSYLAASATSSDDVGSSLPLLLVGSLEVRDTFLPVPASCQPNLICVTGIIAGTAQHINTLVGANVMLGLAAGVQ